MHNASTRRGRWFLVVAAAVAAAGCSSSATTSYCPTAAANTMLDDASEQTLASALKAHSPSDRELALAAAFWVLVVKSSHDGTVDPILVTSGLADAVSQSAGSYPGLFEACPASGTGSTASALGAVGAALEQTFTCEQSCLPKMGSIETTSTTAVEVGVGLLTKGTDYSHMWELYTSIKTTVDSAENKGSNTVDAIAASMQPAQSAWVLNTMWNVIKGAQAAAKVSALLGEDVPAVLVAGELGYVVALVKAAMIARELQSAYATYRDCSAYMKENCNCTPACPQGQSCIGNVCMVCASDGYCKGDCGGCCGDADCPSGQTCTAGTCVAQACDQTSCASADQCVDGCGDINPTFCGCAGGGTCAPGTGVCKATCTPTNCASPGTSCLDDCGGINPGMCGCAGAATCLPNGSCPTPGCDTEACAAWTPVATSRSCSTNLHGGDAACSAVAQQVEAQCAAQGGHVVGWQTDVAACVKAYDCWASACPCVIFCSEKCASDAACAQECMAGVGQDVQSAMAACSSCTQPGVQVQCMSPGG